MDDQSEDQEEKGDVMTIDGTVGLSSMVPPVSAYGHATERWDISSEMDD
jgi:hypothetical protein